MPVKMPAPGELEPIETASRDELRRMVRQAATLDGETLPEAERPALAVSE